MQQGAAQKIISNTKTDIAQDSRTGNGGWDEI